MLEAALIGQMERHQQRNCAVWGIAANAQVVTAVILCIASGATPKAIYVCAKFCNMIPKEPEGEAVMTAMIALITLRLTIGSPGIWFTSELIIPNLAEADTTEPMPTTAAVKTVVFIEFAAAPARTFFWSGMYLRKRTAASTLATTMAIYTMGMFDFSAPVHLRTQNAR